MIKMCKDCINAKNRTNEPMMYCGKHRRYISKYTMAYSNILDQKECKDYDEGRFTQQRSGNRYP